jgi:ubiquinone/menaquinone biosynthesis C-methylase UbiE
MMERKDYGEKYAEVYVQGRQLSPQAEAAWVEAIGHWLTAGRRWTVVDVGAGTGRFSALLARRLGAEVIGVEPSDKMRRVAEVQSAAPGVVYRAGYAEALPCEDESCDAAWLSMVFHHLKSVPDAGRELYRVLRPGGLVLIRISLKESLGSVRFYDFFPSARRYDERRMPSLEEMVRVMGEAGFEHLGHERIGQQLDESLMAHCERIKLRAISSLEQVGPEEWAEGLRMMERAAGAAEEPKPVMEWIDLVVFRKGKTRG